MITFYNYENASLPVTNNRNLSSNDFEQSIERARAAGSNEHSEAD